MDKRLVAFLLAICWMIGGLFVTALIFFWPNVATPPYELLLVMIPPAIGFTAVAYQNLRSK